MLGLDLANDDFLTVMVTWGKKLSEMKEPCVDISDDTLFHWKCGTLSLFTSQTYRAL
jgi:hypothetical protein